MEVLKR